MILHILQQIKKSAQPLREFLKKLSNDWVMTSAAGLAYNLINATIPIAIALIAVLGFTIGKLDATAHARLIESLKNVFPAPIASQNVLETAFTTFRKDAGFLTILALLTAIFSGSRLFIAIESYFDIIYRTDKRKLITQNVMAVLMLCVFIILTPLIAFASSIPALILLLLENGALNHLPGIALLAKNSLILSTVSILESVIVTWILFEAIYMVVPNQKMSFRKTWKGALVAALILEIFLILFPFYITHFMGNTTGFIGFILIFLFFFYYFAAILLIGAEVNAFYVEGVHALPDNLANFIHRKARETEQGDAADFS